MAGIDVVITGIGQSAVGRKLAQSGLELTVDAALEAIADAGLTVADIAKPDLPPQRDTHQQVVVRVPDRRRTQRHLEAAGRQQCREPEALHMAGSAQTGQAARQGLVLVERAARAQAGSQQVEVVERHGEKPSADQGGQSSGVSRGCEVYR